MKEVRSPLLSRIAPIVLSCLDARRHEFGIASVTGAELSADQADMCVYISCERDPRGACNWARHSVREIMAELRKSGLLRRLPYISFRPTPEDRGPVLARLLDDAGKQVKKAAQTPVASTEELVGDLEAEIFAEADDDLPEQTSAPAKKTAALSPARKPVKKTVPEKKVAKKR